jgi:RNA polymerase sigma-70 factor (ECF subfamily)
MKAGAGSGDQRDVGSQSVALEDVRPELDLDAIYAENAPFLTRVLIRLVGDGPQVDDLLQETFIVAHRKRASFDGRSAVRTWLYGIAAHLSMRHGRGLGRWRRALGIFAEQPTRVPANPVDELERAQAAQLLRATLERLPFKQREVVVLYELEELDGDAIAVLLGIPINTVWTRLHHGRKRLQELMRKQIDRSAR